MTDKRDASSDETSSDTTGMDTQPAVDTSLQDAPATAQARGEDALDVALQGSMITSDPPSSLMPDDEAGDDPQGLGRDE